MSKFNYFFQPSPHFIILITSKFHEYSYLGDIMNLELGSIGDEVKNIQAKLKKLGFYKGLITGSFGPSLEEGVKAFQKSIGLPETGIVNSTTKERIDFYTTPAIAPISVLPTLRKGDRGSNVLDLQTKLKALLYYTGPLNSNFDLETENAVKRLQLNNGLTADGIVGNNTWNTINSLYGNLADCTIENIPSNDYITYTVVPGDTLYAIARRYNTTVDAIKSLNNLSNNIINIGQTLKIPNNNANNYLTYTVKRGDTLYGIARTYETTVNAIKSLNNITSDILSIGQVLKIPVKEETSYITYIVMKNDTLYSIARHYNTTVNAIKSLNNFTSDNLRIGQVLKIPN